MDEFYNLRDIAKEIGVTYQTVKSRTEFLEIEVVQIQNDKNMYCLLYTSDAADE